MIDELYTFEKGELVWVISGRYHPINGSKHREIKATWGLFISKEKIEEPRTAEEKTFYKCKVLMGKEIYWAAEWFIYPRREFLK